MFKWAENFAPAGRADTPQERWLGRLCVAATPLRGVVAEHAVPGDEAEIPEKPYRGRRPNEYCGIGPERAGFVFTCRAIARHRGFGALRAGIFA